MNILNDVVSGAARQFGREFGRAGANKILNGANSYTIKSASEYEGRIKPSDSQVIRSIKEIKRVKFVSTNKANISRLIEITDLTLPHFQFKGVETLNQIDDILELSKQYESKFNHGSALVDDDYKEKSVEFLHTKRSELLNQIKDFNKEIKEFVSSELEKAELNKKKKSTATLLAIPLLGLQWAYLKAPGYTLLSILFCWTIIVPIVNLIHLLKLLTMSEEKFDSLYNARLSFFRQFASEDTINK